MQEFRADHKPTVEVERNGEMALVSVRQLVSETVDEEQRPVIEYDFHQFTDLYSDDLQAKTEQNIEAVIAACIESEQRQERREAETRLNTEKVLEAQSLNAMLATTELYEMLISTGGM